MSNIRATTISDETGNGPIALTKQIALKAYSEQDNTSDTINQSLNQSSITDSGVGNKIHTWTSAFANNTYLMLVGAAGNRGTTTSTTRGIQPDAAWTTTAADVRYAYATNNANDDTQCGMSVVGDLA